MIPESTVSAPSRLRVIVGAARDRVSRLPIWVGAAGAGVFILAIALFGFHPIHATSDSSLRLKVQHSFRGAQLTVWVDGETAYSGKLVGYTKKKFGLIPDSVQGSMTDTVGVPSGKHQVKVRVAGNEGSVQEDTIAGDFASNNQRTLAISARPGNLSLNWQGVVLTPAPESGSNMGGYISTLLLTAAGSIVSALTGYAIKELPNFVRARQANTPKA